jgi:hypothetical protein
VAALTHSINTDTWGTTGISRDGMAIPDSAAFQQQRVLDAGPGARLPEEIDPAIAFQDGCPIVASSSIGVTHCATLPLLYGVLGYDLDLQRASERPALLLPAFANFPALGIVERVTEGKFPSDVRATSLPACALWAKKCRSWRRTRRRPFAASPSASAATGAPDDSRATCPRISTAPGSATERPVLGTGASRLTG